MASFDSSLAHDRHPRNQPLPALAGACRQRVYFPLVGLQAYQQSEFRQL
jgi:hypothetical protein